MKVARFGFGQRDQLTHIARGQGGVRGQHHRCRSNLRNACKIAQGVVRQFGVQRGVGDVGVGSQHQCVTIGRALLHQVRADDRAPAGAVIHQHLLAPCGGKLDRQRARQQISAAAGDERHDDAHGACRKSLSMSISNHQQHACY